MISDGAEIKSASEMVQAESKSTSDMVEDAVFEMFEDDEQDAEDESASGIVEDGGEQLEHNGEEVADQEVSELLELMEEKDEVAITNVAIVFGQILHRCGT